MQILRSLDAVPTYLLHGAVSIGNFDGVHRGHEHLVTRLVHWKNRLHGPSIVFTFDPHPVQILRPDRAPVALTWTERKADLLAKLGVDFLIAYPATHELLQMSHREFFQDLIISRLQAKAMIEGPNFFFGKDRLGNTEALEILCKEHGIELEIVEPETDAQTMISSSRLRETIAAGDFATVRKLQAHRYRIRGRVEHGAGRGSEFGFPTANLTGVDTLIPRQGVYSGIAWWQNQAFSTAVNIGSNPTFADDNQKIECHLLGFAGNLYGETLELEFVEKLREIKRFESPAELRAQIEHDLMRVRDIDLTETTRTTKDL